MIPGHYELFTKYGVPLESIAPGKPFRMLNYQDTHIRVETGYDVMLYKEHSIHGMMPFNDDGHHIPVVNLTTGSLFWMAKIKPCLLI